MSLTNVPDITVNQAVISADDISAEMQYHPAESRRQAMIDAAQSLIVGEVIRQRGIALDLIPETQELSASDEDSLIEHLIEIEVDIPSAGEEECHRYYLQNEAKFCSAPLLEVRHILLASAYDDVEGRSQGKELAEQLIQTLQKQPSAFADLARKHSACPSKEQDGNLGQISQGQTVREFEKALLAAPVGLLSTAIESRFGFHVAEVMRRVEGEALPYGYVVDDIRSYLNEKVRQKALSQYIQQLIKDAEIQGFEFDLDAGPLLQ